ncbi:MAG: hypothetical protein R2731_14620 [Nocardioides sp.]
MPAHAKDGDVRVTGTCTASSTSKLKLGLRDGGIEMEFQVDQNVNGATWNVRVLQNGGQVFKGNRTTKAPSGAFTLKRKLANAAGTDTVRASATNPATGETCTATASI